MKRIIIIGLAAGFGFIYIMAIIAAGLSPWFHCHRSCTRRVATMAPAPAPTAAAFGDLAVYFDANFPTTRERLEQCRANHEAACLASYEQVQRGRAELFRAGEALALMHTMVALEGCDPAQWKHTPEGARAATQCRGAGVALFYFQDRTSDDQIRSFLGPHRQMLRGLVAQTRARPWLAVRPARVEWAELLGSLPLERGGRCSERSVVMRKLMRPGLLEEAPSH
jgi:hypothetical protein